MGRAGKLNFTLDHVKAPDGSNVRLRASTIRKGDDKTGTVIVGTVLLSPLFLIMRGKDVSIPRGTTIAAYVDGDREIAMPSAVGSVSQGTPPSNQVSGTGATASINVTSTPTGADINVDGKYVGNTPLTVQITAGDHNISIQLSGYKTWQRTITTTAGSAINLSATLER